MKNQLFKITSSATLALTLFSATAGAVDVSKSDEYLGHKIYILSGGDEASNALTDAKVAMSAMINRDKTAALNADQKTKRENLQKARVELARLSKQLGSALLKQDAVLVVALTSTTVFGTAMLGRLSMEGSEKLIGAAEKVVPDVRGLGWLNRSLLGAKGFMDGVGKATGKITIVSGAIGSAATLYLFLCERDNVKQLAGEVATSLNEVEHLIAQIDFVEGTSK